MYNRVNGVFTQYNLSVFCVGGIRIKPLEPGAFVNQTDDIIPLTGGHSGPIIAYHLLIQGRVQGVWYRASFQQVAIQLGVRGWCRNCADGAVEAWIQGPEAQVEVLLEWAQQGPPQAEVTRIITTHKTVDSDLLTHGEFEVRATC